MYVATFGIGKVAFQALTFRVERIREGFADEFRGWENKSIKIWPPPANDVVWPPAESFDEHGLNSFHNRWI
jgi:hypothetical protein